MKMKRSKVYYYQLSDTHKKTETDIPIYMVRVSENQAIQSKTFEFRGDLMESIINKLIPEIKEFVGYIILDFPKKHKRFQLIDNIFVEMPRTL